PRPLQRPEPHVAAGGRERHRDLCPRGLSRPRRRPRTRSCTAPRVTERRRMSPSSRQLLDGIDLVVFDKDGTLIDFDAMWSPWVVELCGRLERATGRPISERLFVELGFDAAAGRTIAGGPLAVLPMALLRGAVGDVVVRAGVDEAAAAAA